MDELEKLCIPVTDWLKRNGNPYSSVRITEDRIELLDTAICIPVEKAVD
jgi:hypothetical protein